MVDTVNGFDDQDTRRISDTVGIVLGTQSGEGSRTRPSDVQLAVLAKPVELLLELQWMTDTFDVGVHVIDGDVYREEIIEPARVVTNGLQIAVPVLGAGLCVQDSAFWAVNIDTLNPATHPLTGPSTGIAAVVKVTNTGTLQVTDDRLEFIRRDATGVIEDGTLIQLAYVSGTLTIVWADCEPHADLMSLEADPGGPMPPPEDPL